MEDSTSQKRENKLAQKYIPKSRQVEKSEFPVYVGKLKEEATPASFFKKHLGEENLQVPNKVIMLVGATGSGKTTLTNWMINYILGVQWGDGFRLKLIHEGKIENKAESQTSEVMAYVVNYQEGFQVPYSLTIIDTPGFGSTKGIDEDKSITEKIREYFLTPGGIDHIDAVCIVVQSSSARLTPNQKYVFDSVLSIFGKDIKGNIHILVTFADGQTPPVLETIKEAKVPCAKDDSGAPVHFKFNNSALFANNAAGGGPRLNFDEMFWEMGTGSMKTFFDSLNKLETKSLTLTKEVLRERKELETALAGLRPQISVVLVKLEELRKTQQVLDQHKEDMEANRDFEYEIETTESVKEDTDHYATNCMQCKFTCCYPCWVPWDVLNRLCSAISLYAGKCNVCPGHCSARMHSLQKYKYVNKVVKQKRTYEDLKQKYQKHSEEVMTIQTVLLCLTQEYADVRAALQALIKRASRSLQRLQEIALKPNPLSTPEYIDLLIKEQEGDQKPGYAGRIQSLKEAKEVAEKIQKTANKEPLLPGEPDLFEQTEEKKDKDVVRHLFKKRKVK